MPPLSSLNISHNPSPVPTPATQYQQEPPASNSPFVNDQGIANAPSVISSPQNGQAPISQPALVPQQANVQSWASDNMQQPRPMQPQANAMGGMWNPDIGIRFGGGSPISSPPAQNQPQGGGTWNPGSGIKFG